MISRNGRKIQKKMSTWKDNDIRDSLVTRADAGALNENTHILQRNVNVVFFLLIYPDAIPHLDVPDMILLRSS